MSALAEEVAEHLSVRRAMGHKLQRAEGLLSQFVAHLDAVGATTVTVDEALSWAMMPAGASRAWMRIRLGVVRSFATWLQARDPSVEVPPLARRECILKLARENPRWGYRRIQGEALKLGLPISHMQVARILRSQGIPPAPRRGRTSWREFVRQHAAQTLACDFFTVETAWLDRLHVLFFTEIASRKVHLGGITANPAGEWVTQQARNLAWKLQDEALRAKFLLRDRDSKFTAGFDQVFRSEGVDLRLPYRAPRANSIAERFVGTCRREVLDHLLIFSARHLEAVLKEFLAHYHQARPHQGLDQRCPVPGLPALIPLPVGGRIIRHDRLGGLLHEYSRAA